MQTLLNEVSIALASVMLTVICGFGLLIALLALAYRRMSEKLANVALKISSPWIFLIAIPIWLGLRSVFLAQPKLLALITVMPTTILAVICLLLLFSTPWVKNKLRIEGARTQLEVAEIIEETSKLKERREKKGLDNSQLDRGIFNLRAALLELHEAWHDVDKHG